MKIGEKIKQLRKEKSISQEQLANKLGVSFQAVSKWETGATTPDIGLIPSIAYYFHVSIDELFDYHSWETRQTIDELCSRAAKLIRYDAPAAEKLLNEGLVRFPGNEKILTVLVYALWVIPDRDEELVSTCTALLECCTDEGVKCDVIRFLAMVYHRTGRQELVKPTLDQIPEFYFTKLQWMAKLTQGQGSLEAAQLQLNLSGNCLVEMLEVLADRYGAMGNKEKSTQCRHLRDGVLTVFRDNGGCELEIAGYEWLDRDGNG